MTKDVICFLFIFSSVFWGVFCSLSQRARQCPHADKNVWISFFLGLLFMPVGLLVAAFNFEKNRRRFRCCICKNCGHPIQPTEGEINSPVHCETGNRTCGLESNTMAEFMYT